MHVGVPGQFSEIGTLFAFFLNPFNWFTCDFKRDRKRCFGRTRMGFQKSKKIWERIWATRILKLHCSLTNYLFFLGDADPESNDMKYPVLLMGSVHKISQDLPSVLNDKNRKKLAKIMQNLGFDDLVPLFYEMPPDRERRVNIPFHINYSTFTSEYCSNVVLTFLLSLYATKVRGVIDMTQTSLSL